MLTYRNMTGADLELGMRLKRAAGWNQTEADWRRFLSLGPDGCFVAELEGQPVGTVTTCAFDTVAWIAMVLVDPAARGKGVGTGLMTRALAHLDERGVAAVRLDATPQGRPIYEKLGFTIDFELARYEGTLPVDGGAVAGVAGVPGVPGVEVVEGPLPAEASALVRQVTGTEYRRLLNRLHGDNPGATLVFRRGGMLQGVGMSRAGVNAGQIGPCVAGTPEAGLGLMEALRSRHAGARVFVDIPLGNRPAVAWAGAAGLKVQRPFYRMTRGVRVKEEVVRMWASSGPEMG